MMNGELAVMSGCRAVPARVVAVRILAVRMNGG